MLGGEFAAGKSAGIGFSSVFPSPCSDAPALISLGGGLALFGIEAGHELEGAAGFLFHRKDFFTSEEEAVGLGANEGGRHGHVLSDKSEVEGEVVTIDLHAPGFGGGGGAEKDDPEVRCAKATASEGSFFGLDQHVIGEHELAGFGEAFVAENGGEEIVSTQQLGFIEVAEPEASAFGGRGSVGPRSSLGVLGSASELLALGFGECFKETLGREYSRLRGVIFLSWLHLGEHSARQGEGPVTLCGSRAESDDGQE